MTEKETETDIETDTSEPDLEGPELEGPELESPELEEPEPAPDPTPAVRPKGRVLATFAFLFSLAAIGGAGYLYYLLVYLQPLQDVQTQNSSLRLRYVELESKVEQQITALQQASTTALAEVSRETQERLAGNEDAVLKSLNNALVAAPPSQREWKLAEAEYLLRIANHRVLMAQDSVGALSLLQAVDQIILELDDFSLYQIRARLADEIIALRQVPRNDLQGIYLRVEALKSQLDDLPLPRPAYLQPEEALDPEQPVWQTLLDELKKFIRVRSLSSGEVLKPLLAPEEERYLELNLRLTLEQTQLAVLKRHQEVYLQSLQTARRWFVDHVDPTDKRTQLLLQSVDELMLIELRQPIPDISGSLNELLGLRRSGA
jgi:uroporphyrin-3 C-methyltransferase